MSFVGTHLRGVLRRPARLLLTGIAIAVAAFFATAAILTHDIAKATALSTVTSIPDGVDYVQESTGDDPVKQLYQVRHTPHVTEAVGRASAPTTLDGQHVYLTADPGSGPLSRVRLTSGTYPASKDQVAVSQRVPFIIGQQLHLGTSTLVVTGTVDAPSSDGPAVYTTDDSLFALLPAQLNRIDITSDGPVDLSGAVTAGEARAAELDATTSKIDQLLAVLTAFVIVAVIAALLVATSTFRIVFAQRTRQLALLRAVGAARRTLVRALVAEGALVGFVAGAIGTAPAIGLGYLVPQLLHVSGPGRAVFATPLVVVASILVTMLAVLAPARSATRVSPLEALRTSDIGAKDVGPVRIGVGVLLLVAAGFVINELFADGVTSTYRPSGATLHYLLLTIASGTLVFCSLLALGPVLLKPVLRGLSALLAPLGPAVRLAVQGVGGAPRRAAAVSAVVALGTGLLTGVLVGGQTVRTFNNAEVAAAFPADMLLSATAQGEPRPLPSGLADRLRARSEIGQVLPYRVIRHDALVNGNPMNFHVSDLDLRSLPGFGDLRATEGSLDDLGPGKVLLTSTYARISQVGVGGTITLGPVTEKVVAVVVGESLAGSGVVIDRRDMDRLDSDGPTDILVSAPSRQAQAVARSVVGPGVQIEVLSDERARQSDVIDTLEVLALAVLTLTLLIAIVGVGTTAALSVVERRRESGMLRAIGLTRFALGSITVAEAALHGLIGILFGLVIGVPHAWFAVLALGLDSPLDIPVPALLIASAGLIALTMLAGLLPARRTAKASPVAAMRVD